MTLSPPVRVAALVAAFVLTGLAAFVFLLGGRAAQDDVGATAAPATKPAVHTPTKPAAPVKPAVTHRKPALAPDLPRPVALAFRNRQIVVVAVYVPGSAVDADVRKEARAGARMAVAGFVPVSAASENALSKIVAKTGILPSPAVVIMRRPGIAVTTLGVADRQTVAAAVAQAKAHR
jgi:hypothetical protein